jgi:omega-hydroxy-beta-dihydromenaquinone-9 sulfotransferase
VSLPDEPRSVFIVGCPRSGTSVFFKTFSQHPSFAFTTNLTRRFRSHFPLVRMAEMLGGKHRPVEAAALWKGLWPTGVVERTAEDLTESQRRRLLKMVRGHIRHFGRPVFLNKKPGMALRIRWLAAALPGCRIIHVLRDGRSVANSILEQCKKADKRWSYVGREMWPELGSMNYARFSGGLWSRITRVCDDACQTLPREQVLTVRYEDFVSNTAGTLSDAADFCGVPWGKEHAHLIPELSSRNDKWKRMMTAEEQRDMLEEAGEGLRHFGYLQDSVC